MIKLKNILLLTISSIIVFTLITTNNINDQKKQTTVVIVIDVFRAATTAAFILSQNPKAYYMTNKTSVIAKLAAKCDAPVLIGKSEKNMNLSYNITNSPTRVAKINLHNRYVLHRTEAGANGLLLSKNADQVLLAGLVNAKATANYIKSIENPKIIFLPMGHEGKEPSLEDHLCAIYIKSLLLDQQINIHHFESALYNGPGKYFFSTDQLQYPKEDFSYCLAADSFDFAIKASFAKEYAILKRCY